MAVPARVATWVVLQVAVRPVVPLAPVEWAVMLHHPMAEEAVAVVVSPEVAMLPRVQRAVPVVPVGLGLQAVRVIPTPTVQLAMARPAQAVAVALAARPRTRLVVRAAMVMNIRSQRAVLQVQAAALVAAVVCPVRALAEVPVLQAFTVRVVALAVAAQSRLATFQRQVPRAP
jgi:hypothetical protein